MISTFAVDCYVFVRQYHSYNPAIEPTSEDKVENDDREEDEPEKQLRMCLVSGLFLNIAKLAPDKVGRGGGEKEKFSFSSCLYKYIIMY